jgi:hypothetical protein
MLKMEGLSKNLRRMTQKEGNEDERGRNVKPEHKHSTTPAVSC